MRTLQTTDLSKSYRGRKVVDNVSVNVKQGEVVGLKRNGDAAQIEISLTSAGDDILVCCCRDISNRRAQEQIGRAHV